MSIEWGIYQSLLAIPPALTALKELLAGGGNRRDALTKISEIDNNLKRFSKVGDWLWEAKEYHERLTQLDLSLDGLRNQVDKPRARGGFDPDLCDIPEMRKHWQAVRETMMKGLLIFFQKMDQLASVPLTIKDNKIAVAGPEYAVALFNISIKIDASFKGYTKKPIQKEAICELVETLSDQVKDQIFYVDDEIREQAGKIAQALRNLRGEL